MQERIVLVIDKNFWDLRSLQQLIQKVKGQTGFQTEYFLACSFEVSQICFKKIFIFYFLFQGPVAASDVAKSLIPNDGLPYVSGVGPVENEELIERFQNKDSVPFTLNRNLRVYVKLVNCKFVFIVSR